MTDGRRRIPIRHVLPVHRVIVAQQQQTQRQPGQLFGEQRARAGQPVDQHRRQLTPRPYPEPLLGGAGGGGGFDDPAGGPGLSEAFQGLLRRADDPHRLRPCAELDGARVKHEGLTPLPWHCPRQHVPMVSRLESADGVFHSLGPG
ncbi:hypothetical protein BG28_06285 [Nesterenkonia sp. AN1]|nr:hypothetical protein BG28_06285 [Nesterenkonia sp. AN1]